MNKWKIESRALAAALLACAVWSCEPGTIVAPPGTLLTAVASPTMLLPGGDSALVSVIASDSSGRPLIDDTRIQFVAAAGTLCIPSADTTYVGERCSDVGAEPLPVAWSRTIGGIAVARFHSGVESGVVRVTMRSGTAVVALDLVVSDQGAPPGSSIYMAASPDTIASHDSTRIDVYVASGTAPVTNGTLVSFHAPSGSFGRAAVLTTGGYASTVFHSDSVKGPVRIYARSGIVLDSLAVFVR